MTVVPTTALLDVMAERDAAERRVVQLEEALAVYADPRHWSIARDIFRYPTAIWIGPGAASETAPDAPKIAREVLA